MPTLYDQGPDAVYRNLVASFGNLAPEHAVRAWLFEGGPLPALASPDVHAQAAWLRARVTGTGHTPQPGNPWAAPAVAPSLTVQASNAAGPNALPLGLLALAVVAVLVIAWRA